MTNQRTQSALALGAAALVLALAACGQDPSFQNRKAIEGHSANSTEDNSGGVDDQGVKGQGAAGGAGTTSPADGASEVALPAGGGNDWAPDWAGGTTPAVDANTNGSTGTTPASSDTATNTPVKSTDQVEPLPDIPDAADGDLDALHKCLSKWKNNPFKGTVTNYQRINASVTVGGFGNAINDTESTPDPFLILIDAGVNVGGAPVYNLMNKNGYYCMKVNVNVLTSLTVNLHCNARLADQMVNVNVGSTQNDTTSAVGVHVLSTVQVNTVRPQGDTCIR